MEPEIILSPQVDSFINSLSEKRFRWAAFYIDYLQQRRGVPDGVSLRQASAQAYELIFYYGCTRYRITYELTVNPDVEITLLQASVSYL
jgi:hypothetical protein